MSAAMYKKKILVVEDEHFMRMIVIQALDSLGFTAIEEAENAETALKQIRDKGPFDLVLSDIEMKPLNGFDLVKQIRTANTRQPHDTRVMFLTGLSDVATLSSASALDVQGFLIKPVSANLLHEKLREVFSRPADVRDAAAFGQMLYASQPVRMNPDFQPQGLPTSQVSAREPTLIKVKPEEMQSGWILQEDVYAKGVLMLTRGTLLKAGPIMVLKDLSAVLDQKKFQVEIPD